MLNSLSLSLTILLVQMMHLMHVVALVKLFNGYHIISTLNQEMLLRHLKNQFCISAYVMHVALVKLLYDATMQNVMDIIINFESRDVGAYQK